MHRTHRVSWITISFTFILLLWSAIPAAEFGEGLLISSAVACDKDKTIHAGTPHVPIAIDGDANFTAVALAEGWPGNGSSASPFVIDGLDIDRGGIAGHCININNTRVNFTISNCNLTGASVNPGAGIYLSNITYGEITGNIFDSNHFNIYLTESRSVVIKNNNCPGSVYSINLRNSSTNNTIANNNCSFNSRGINIDFGANYNTVINNTCNSNTYGMVLYLSDYNTVKGNNCSSNSNDGIHLNNADFNIISSNFCGYVNRVGIYLVQGSESNTIANNTCTHFEHGIFLESGSDFNTVVYNTCDTNDEDGFAFIVWESDSNVVDHNICTNNIYGISIEEDSDFNSVRWNSIIDCQSLAIDDIGFSNIIDYNYYSNYVGVDANGDGIGDAPYNWDPHPLIYLPFSPTWLDALPGVVMLEYESFLHYRYDFNATAPSPINWTVDLTHMFQIDESGVLESVGILPVGEHLVTVIVTNIYGFGISDTFRIIVTLDANNPPGWLIIPTDQTLAFREELDYQIVAIDPSGIDRWELNDTTQFNLQTSSFAGGSTARITNRSILESGSYGLNVTVYDIYDNKLSAILALSVEPMANTETTTTTTSTAPTATTTPPTTPAPEGINPLLTLALGAGIGGASVLILVFVLLRRRS